MDDETGRTRSDLRQLEAAVRRLESSVDSLERKQRDREFNTTLLLSLFPIVAAGLFALLITANL